MGEEIKLKKLTGAKKMLKAFQHKDSHSVPTGAKKKKKIKSGVNPESATKVRMNCKTTMLLHHLVMKICYLPPFTRHWHP
jgi:hypothetical protein